MKLRKELISKLEKIPGLEDRPSKVAGGSAIFYKGKEIAHFHGNHELDIRLTKKVIKSEGLEHPKDSQFHPSRASSSQWMELKFKHSADVQEIVRLFKLAIKEYK